MAARNLCREFCNRPAGTTETRTEEVMISLRFPYVQRLQPGDPLGLAPILPIRLGRDGKEVDAPALVDSGASISVLPLTLGSRFGVDWDSLPHSMPVGGSSGSQLGKVLALEGLIAGFPSVPLLFSWLNTDAYRLVLGQTNFFMLFGVCFFRSQSYFELTLRP